MHRYTTSTLQFSSARDLLQAVRTNVIETKLYKNYSPNSCKSFSMFYVYVPYLFLIIYLFILEIVYVYTYKSWKLRMS